MALFRVITILVVFAASCLSQVSYHGGPVLTQGARVYFIWYGSWANSDKWPFQQFTIGASSGYLAALGGYYDATGAKIQNVSGILGEIDIGAPYGNSPTAVQMIYTMERAINQAKWGCDPLGVYVFMPGPGTYVTGLGGASSHGSFPCGPEDGIGTATSIQVAGIYQPGNMANFSHELVEAMTDPFGNWTGHQGWFQDGTNLEIADSGICGSASYYSLSTGVFLAANYLRLGSGCTSGSGTSGGGGTNPPPSPCPPGTKRRGKNGCK